MNKTVILVHGAFHGSWCWVKVVEKLEKKGVDVIAVDLPGHGNSTKKIGGFKDDVSELQETVESYDSPLVLCGHSYGGAVISNLVDKKNLVKHLVFIASGIPDAGECLADSTPELLSSPLTTACIQKEDGSIIINQEDAIDIFYNECDDSLAKWAASQFRAAGRDQFNHTPKQCTLAGEGFNIHYMQKRPCIGCFCTGKNG